MLPHTDSMTFSEFKAGDLLEIDELAESMTGLGMLYKDPSYGVLLETSGPAYTVRDGGGRVLGCGGIGIMAWGGTGEGWLILSSEAVKKGKSLHRIVKGMLHGIIVKSRLHRVQATVIYSNKTAHKWITRLGFQFECWCLGFSGDGETFARYAWVSPEIRERWERIGNVRI